MPLVGFRGNLLALMRDPLESLLRLWRRYGTFAAITANDPSYVCAFGPAHNRTLLSDDALFEQFFTALPAPPGSALERVSRNALVTVGEEHRRHRRVMGSPFQRRAIEAYRDDMVSVAERVVAGWRAGSSVELTTALRRITLGTILQVVFGIDGVREPGLFEQAERVLGRFLAQLGSELAIMFPVDLPRSPYRRLLEQAEAVDRFVRDIGQRAGAAQGTGGIRSELEAANRAQGSSDVAADLAGQLVTLLLAGQETTNNGLAWALFLLAQHPAVLHDLADELRGTLRGDAPTIQQLERLPLLDRVVKEALRLLPPAANGARRTTAATNLAGWELPKGAVIVFSAFISHHLPEIYSEPDRFLPARWEHLRPSPFEYLPFGAGAHACIGNHFAILEMKIALAVILQRYWPQVLPQRIDFVLKPALAPRRGISALFVPAGSSLGPARIEGQIRSAVAL